MNTDTHAHTCARARPDARAEQQRQTDARGIGRSVSQPASQPNRQTDRRRARYAGNSARGTHKIHDAGSAREKGAKGTWRQRGGRGTLTTHGKAGSHTLLFSSLSLSLSLLRPQARVPSPSLSFVENVLRRGEETRLTDRPTYVRMYVCMYAQTDGRTADERRWARRWAAGRNSPLIGAARGRRRSRSSR